MDALVGRSRGAGLTSVGHHDLFDWSILATLGGGVGGPGEQTRPPYGQEAEAAANCTVPQHAGGTRSTISYGSITQVIPNNISPLGPFIELWPRAQQDYPRTNRREVTVST